MLKRILVLLIPVLMYANLAYNSITLVRVIMFPINFLFLPVVISFIASTLPVLGRLFFKKFFRVTLILAIILSYLAILMSQYFALKWAGAQSFTYIGFSEILKDPGLYYRLVFVVFSVIFLIKSKTYKEYFESIADSNLNASSDKV